MNRPTRKPWGKQVSRHDRGLGTKWDKLRKVILERDRYMCKCSDCTSIGRIRAASEVDHIVPRAKGGTDDPSNLQAINHGCHQIKSKRDKGERIKPRIGVDGWPV